MPSSTLIPWDESYLKQDFELLFHKQPCWELFIIEPWCLKSDLLSTNIGWMGEFFSAIVPITVTHVWYDKPYRYYINICVVWWRGMVLMYTFE